MAEDKKSLNVQPHSNEAELAVLGSMLSSKEAVSKSIQWLKPEDFYKDAHNKIFQQCEYYLIKPNLLTLYLFLNI